MQPSQPMVANQAPAWLMILALLAEAPPQVDEDAMLVRRAQQDLQAFNNLYERHVSRVYRYLLVRVGNVQDAQDLTSLTFLAAMENIHQYKGYRPFVAWLLGIARYKAIDFFRRKQPQAMLETAADVPTLDDPLDDMVGRQLQVEEVAGKLRTISPDRAEAISLRLFGGLDVREIARLMHKEETAVRMLIHRGLRDLRAQLNPEALS